MFNKTVIYPFFDMTIFKGQTLSSLEELIPSGITVCKTIIHYADGATGRLLNGLSLHAMDIAAQANHIRPMNPLTVDLSRYGEMTPKFALLFMALIRLYLKPESLALVMFQSAENEFVTCRIEGDDEEYDLCDISLFDFEPWFDSFEAA
ncbi:hypothetical protein [uncultured Pseudoteredinibacter sp.]|uniref:hypothetical protein n=1 Tax=uncultured Pseudoteredinibacter sp. TaxID=1641701 RepID=UPI00263A3861|nr:hypothetical protein [uncultured Pseudoteredinibacter sp.]